MRENKKPGGAAGRSPGITHTCSPHITDTSTAAQRARMLAALRTRSLTTLQARRELDVLHPAGRKLTREEKRTIMQREVDKKVMLDVWGRDPERVAAVVSKDDLGRVYVPLDRIPGRSKANIINLARSYGSIPAGMSDSGAEKKIRREIERAYALSLMNANDEAIRNVLGFRSRRAITNDRIGRDIINSGLENLRNTTRMLGVLPGGAIVNSGMAIETLTESGADRSESWRYATESMMRETE